MSEQFMPPQLFKEESPWCLHSWRIAHRTPSALLHPETASTEMFLTSSKTALLCLLHYLLTPYNGCIVARNINTNTTCLIVQSKNGAGFNPCHLSLATDLKLVTGMWQLTHTHDSWGWASYLFPCRHQIPVEAFKPSEITALDNPSAQGYSCIRNTSKKWFISTFPCSQLSRWWVSQTRISHSKSCVLTWPEWSLTSYSETLEVSTNWQVLKIQLQK